jgi:hypothetical protein
MAPPLNLHPLTTHRPLKQIIVGLRGLMPFEVFIHTCIFLLAPFVVFLILVLVRHDVDCKNLWTESICIPVQMCFQIMLWCSVVLAICDTLWNFGSCLRKCCLGCAEVRSTESSLTLDQILEKTGVLTAEVELQFELFSLQSTKDKVTLFLILPFYLNYLAGNLVDN